MLQNPFLHPKGEFYNFCHSFSFRHAKHDPVAEQPSELPGACTAADCFPGLGREGWKTPFVPCICSLPFIAGDSGDRWRFAIHMCQVPWAAEWHLQYHEAVPTSLVLSRSPQRPPPAIPADALSPPSSSALSTDFQKSDKIPSYLWAIYCASCILWTREHKLLYITEVGNSIIPTVEGRENRTTEKHRRCFQLWALIYTGVKVNARLIFVGQSWNNWNTLINMGGNPGVSFSWNAVEKTGA